MNDVGTWTWAERTNGRLSRADYLDQLYRGVWARLQASWSRRRDGGPPGVETAPFLPTPPDSALARQAETYAASVSTPSLHAHCLRTWMFASVFGQVERTAFDEELLYLACILHDLGLTPAHDGRDPTAACFAVEGARAAHRLLTAGGDTAARADHVAQAISLHLNVDVRPSLGVEAHLLSRGVSADAVGRDVRRLPRVTVHEVLHRHPRGGFAEELVDATRRQAARRPESRSALLVRFGFSGLVEANLLDSISDRADGEAR